LRFLSHYGYINVISIAGCPLIRIALIGAIREGIILSIIIKTGITAALGSALKGGSVGALPQQIPLIIYAIPTQLKDLHQQK
jgi:hypothetical protein